MRREWLLLALMAASPACSPDDPCPAEGPIDHARASDATHVEVVLRCPLANVSPATVSIEGTVGADAALAVSSVDAAGRTLRLATAPQAGLATYTLRLDGVRDASGRALTASANFVGVGDVATAPVTLTVDDRYHRSLTSVDALVSFDPRTGVYTHYSTRVPLVDPDGDHVFTALARVAVDPMRTLATTDDRLGDARQAYAARAVAEDGTPLSRLVTFEVNDTSAHDVALPLLSVPPPPGPEGLASVHVRVDDTPAHALRAPTLRASVATDGSGDFDAAFPTSVPLVDADGDGVFEASLAVRIDPARHVGGTTSETFPYVLYVASGGSDYPGVGTQVVAPDDSDVDASIRVGNPALVPVTFRVDASAAWLDASGAHRGVAPGEAVFLTGELAGAEDAFGQNASDAFTGGENVVLEMVPRGAFWERTIFLAPDRPYGWKAVRCPSGHGCAEINRHVTSSGRAFATVMKNLASENLDASSHDTVRIVDPRAPTVTLADGSTLSYAGPGVNIHIGDGTGVEPDPPGTPDGVRLFKQELPDLVVQVGHDPVTTPVIVVGTWRDVNLPQTLAQIVAADGTFDLNPWDYDAGFVGAAPPSYEAQPPPPPHPPPAFQLGDGQIDTGATHIAGGAGEGTMILYAAVSGTTLYVATDDAGEGSDHFLFVAARAPSAADARSAPWAKAGTVAAAPGTMFLADENDSSFVGWFRLGASPADDALVGGACAAQGGVLEGTIDLATTFAGSVPDRVYLAAGPWSSEDGGHLYGTAQVPRVASPDGNLDADEWATVVLDDVRVAP